MVMTASTMLALGTQAPDFCLPDTTGRMVSRDDFKDSAGLLVMFMCNHCPYVKHVRTELARLGKDYQDKGIAIVGINSNDVETHPDDSPEMMVREIKEAGYTFAYLYDETQETAKTYRAACTPDFFLFDGDHKLVYRGQLDDSRPGNSIPVTGNDLRKPLDALLAGNPIPEDQTPSMGCNIKWKADNAPDYF